MGFHQKEVGVGWRDLVDTAAQNPSRCRVHHARKIPSETLESRDMDVLERKSRCHHFYHNRHRGFRQREAGEYWRDLLYNVGLLQVDSMYGAKATVMRNDGRLRSRQSTPYAVCFAFVVAFYRILLNGWTVFLVRP